MKILITGAKGLLGNVLSRLAKKEHTVLTTDISELDITDERQVKEVIQNFNPDVIINCAVISPTECEKNPKLAEQVNIFGVRNLLNHKGNAKLIHFSSPAVFDGLPPLDKGQEYKEEDLPKPRSVYGRTKFESEKLLEGTDCLVIRTSWLYSDSRTLEKKPYATNEIARPTYCGDIWEFIIVALKKDLQGLFHVCGPEIMSRFEQTKSLFGETGKEDLVISSIRPLSTIKSSKYFEKYGIKQTSWREFLKKES